MNDELGCFLCFGSLVVGSGLFVLVIAWNDARAKIAAMRLYLEGQAAEASAMRRTIGELERRIRTLESTGVRAALEAPRPEVARGPQLAAEPAAAPEGVALAPSARAAESTVAASEPRSTFARPVDAGAPIETPAPIAPIETPAPIAPIETPAPIAPVTTDAAAATQAAAPPPAADASPVAAEPPRPAPNATEPSRPAPNAPNAPEPPRPAPIAPRPTTPNLEQWLGVRGAAAAGSIVLAIAGVYFFRFSLEHGLISETTRVIIGLLVGMGCVLVSEVRLRHTNRILSQFLAGAGFAILYLAVWAAVALYHLIPSAAATVAMIAITTTSCALAYVRHAIPTAALGLIGGFATPILLSTGQDRPIALFSYLFLLDVGLLLLARARKWSWLGAVSLVFTLLYQVVWIGARLDAPRAWLGVLIVAVFGALFAVASPRGDASTPIDRLTRSLAIGMAGVFAFLFGSHRGLGDNLVPTATLLVLLTGSGAFLARIDGSRIIRPATAAAATATLLALASRTSESPAGAIRFALATLTLLAIQFAANELDRRRPTPSGASAADAFPTESLGFEILLFGALLLELVAVARGSHYQFVVHYLSAAAILGVATLESIRGGRSGRMLPFLLFLAILSWAMHWGHAGDPGVPSSAAILGMMLALALAAFVAPLGIRRRRPTESTRLAEHGAGAFAVSLLIGTIGVPLHDPLAMVPFFGIVVAVVLLCSLVASLREHGGWPFVAVLVATLALTVYQGRITSDGAQVAMLVGLGVCALVVMLIPRLVVGAAREHPMTHRAGSLAGPAVFAAAAFAFEDRFGRDVIGLLPLALSFFGLFTIANARKSVTSQATRDSATVWGAIASLTMIAIAIPMQLHDEWVTVSWALEGAIAILIWRRFDHPGLKYYALGLFSFVFIRLVANPAVLEYHPPSGRPIVNWLAYGYLLPAAAMVFAGRILAELELARRRPLERSIFGEKVPLAGVVFLFAILVGFAWVNLTVIDAFAAGRSLAIPFERRPARDLAISLAWAAYAIVLLAVGMWKNQKALRLVSLILVIITCLKVFLYDLGNLEDLYRVASLVGLAVALIGVSLAYKRFVFTDAEEERS